MTQSITNLQELLVDLVVPERRRDVDITSDHLTLLHGNKSKKQLEGKGKPIIYKKRSNTLTRREYAKLGLFTLPTRQLKYEQVEPLHRLWKSYIKEHLNLRAGETVPDVCERRYDAFSKLLIKSDLHGAKIRIIKSKCATLLGLCGIIVMDTKNVLKIIAKDDRLRTIPKNECIFDLSLGNMNFTIFGKHLRIRPAERAVKKIKGFIEPFT